jgi:hypothetical protein
VSSLAANAGCYALFCSGMCCGYQSSEMSSVYSVLSSTCHGSSNPICTVSTKVQAPIESQHLHHHHPQSRFQISKLSILPIKPHENMSSLLVSLSPLEIFRPLGSRLPAITISAFALALVFDTNTARSLRLLCLAWWWRRRRRRWRRCDDVVRVAVDRHVGTETIAVVGFFNLRFGFAAATAGDDVVRVEIIVTFVLE